MPIALHNSGDFVIYCEKCYQDIRFQKYSEYVKQQFRQKIFFFRYASEEYIQLLENKEFWKYLGLWHMKWTIYKIREKGFCYSDSHTILLG